jgi:hypothetical protein
VSLSVALLPSSSLGDGLIHAAIANNLQRNGCAVRYFHDGLCQLADFAQGYGIESVPSYETVCETLADTEVILYDSTSPFTQRMPPELAEWFAANGVCYGVTHHAPVHTSITPEKLARRARPGQESKAARFAHLNVSLRQTGLGWPRKPVVRQLVDRVAELLPLQRKTYANGLAIPRLNGAAGGRRVIIHPTSSSPAKNWPPDRFLELVRRLSQEGWEPVITVSPAEQAEWRARVGEDAALRVFPGLKELAEYYASAAAFIGNDSGAGHLASCIGLPTVLIYKRWRRHPPWRHGWAPTRVVFARGLSARGWQQRISVDRVASGFYSLVGRRPPPDKPAVH